MRSSIYHLRRVPWALALTLAACGDDGPLEPVPRLPVALEIVSGNGQVGTLGYWLDAFVVRVTDARGEGIDGVEVRWSVTSGIGRLIPFFYTNFENGRPLSVISTRTDSDGLASALFRPSELGSSTVTASLATTFGGIRIQPVTFGADMTRLVIEIAYSRGCWWVPCFEGPDGSADVTVPVGTTVEWVNRSEDPATVTSTSVPPGGEAFDSGTLDGFSRSFQFVPQVAGTWEYVDQFGGETGTLTVEGQ